MSRKSITTAFTLACVAGTASAAVWDDARDTVLPLQAMMGSMYDDLDTLSNSLGYHPDRLFIDFVFSAESMVYSFAPGTTIDGMPVGLSGSLVLDDDGESWNGTSNILGLRSGTGKTFKVTYTENTATKTVDFQIVGNTSSGLSYLKGWTVEWNDNNDRLTATSTHPDGGTDNLTRNIDKKTYTWRVQNVDKKSVHGEISWDLPSSGTAIAHIPGPGALVMFGLALLTTRRGR